MAGDHAMPPGRPGGYRRVLEQLEQRLDSGHSSTLCIVAATEGSTYRKPGAVALATPDGLLVGSVSGGCLEPDLIEAASAALGAGAPRCVSFDSLGDDDLVFGSGSGCRGILHVWLVPCGSAGDGELPRLFLSQARAAESLLCAVYLDGPSAGHGSVWREAASPSSRAVVIGAGATLTPPVDVGNLPATALDGSGRVAYFRIGGIPRLLLVGAGPEAGPLGQFGRAMGWSVSLADHRDLRLEELGCDFDQLLCQRPAAAVALAGLRLGDAAIVMTHTASRDLEALEALAKTPVGYVGLLGPPARRDELLEALPQWAAVALRPRLRAPVGMRLGGHGPEPLALSIIAQLHQYYMEPSTNRPGASA